MQHNRNSMRRRCVDNDLILSTCGLHCLNCLAVEHRTVAELPRGETDKLLVYRPYVFISWRLAQ